MSSFMKYRGVKGTVEKTCGGTAWKGHLVLDGFIIKYWAATFNDLHDQFVKKVDTYLHKNRPFSDKYAAAIGKPVALKKSDDGLNWHGLPGSLTPSQKMDPVSKPSKKESILDTANRIINGERPDSYGAPEDSFQIIAEYWSTYLNGKFKKRTPGFKFVLDPVDVANLQILFKQARKLGEKPTRDTYTDSVGYEAIAADRLSKFDE